ncbi:hypothetical protein M409DRAFT_50810 [Zasmidium cellare ATCC 36951]|uniref:Uncharacterized protein n=1 Tax=Zasmidium cellare ATCC 36951 TaxID=1080233 RepID=A0A6A6CVZ1_ZASCE|nr:uncharacterized protein M409DRAFT_50810 [Zasmidium cellare ATCC 36951]KAF2171357.1 hypothetical protein M409DRAFT_50810 [Zasmidium cellare ATCC 36951]
MATRNPPAVGVLSILLSMMATSANSQYAYGSIASCADFDCNTGISNCTVQERSYNVAGSVQFPSPFGDNTNLTWTTGAVMAYPDGPTYPNLVKDYYLGTPPDLDLSSEDGVNGFHGCAAFFVDSNASFPSNQQPGTCGDVLGSKCVTALTDQAEEAIGDTTFRRAEDLCSRLQAITVPLAPQPPTTEQNASSNCHPVIPSTHNLAFTLNFNASCCDDSLWSKTLRGIGNDTNPSEETIIDFLEHQAVPILTKFGRVDGSEDGGDVPQSRLTSLSCLEAPVEAKNLASQASDAEGDEGAAAAVLPGGSWVAIVVAIAVGFAAFA